MLQLAGDGQARPRARKSWNRRLNYDRKIDHHSAEIIESVMLASLVDPIASKNPHRRTNSNHPIDIPLAYTATDRIASAVSSPGACPSPRPDRSDLTSLSHSLNTRRSASAGDRQPLTLRVTRQWFEDSCASIARPRQRSPGLPCL
jgi:hypothetical protein